MTQKNSYFEQGELEDLLARADPPLDPYSSFMESCKKKKYPTDTILEKHHIIPKHEGGGNEESNLIRLSIKDHIAAHWLRWQVFGSLDDRRAYLFRVSTPEERVKLQLEIIKANVAEYKKNNMFFYNSDFQRKQGLKGGSKGGFANTQAQWDARSRVGLKFGPIVGKSNQSPEMLVFLSKVSLWQFKGYLKKDGTYFSQAKKGPSDSTKVMFYAAVLPKELFKNVAEVLSSFAPGSINLNNVACMYKLVYDRNKRIYGWKCINTLTRSEVEAGALNNLPFDFLTEGVLPE